MPMSPLSVVIQHLRADPSRDGDGKTDGELLARFLRSRDEDALAALVRRHASMVWGVCCRLLTTTMTLRMRFRPRSSSLSARRSDVPSAGRRQLALRRGPADGGAAAGDGGEARAA